MLEVRNLCFVYPDGTRALTDICFALPKASKTFFHGPNGAGKSTLFQCLVGLQKPKSGTILINGKEIPKPKERMRRIGIVFQNANDQIIAGSVYDEIAFGPLNMGLDAAQVEERVEDALACMHIGHLRDKAPHFLSYGQKKRVAIASVLSMDQDILMLDEPTAGLDAKQSEELIEILDNLSAKGTTLLISTHDADFSMRCADHIVVMDQGRLLINGKPGDVFTNTSLLAQASLVRPMVLDVYDSLVKNGLIVAQRSPPCNREELLSMIKR